MAIVSRLILRWLKWSRLCVVLLSQFYENRTVEYTYMLSIHSYYELGYFRLKSIGADTALLESTKNKADIFKRYQKEMMDFGNFLRKTL